MGSRLAARRESGVASRPVREQQLPAMDLTDPASLPFYSGRVASLLSSDVQTCTKVPLCCSAHAINACSGHFFSTAAAPSSVSDATRQACEQMNCPDVAPCCLHCRFMETVGIAGNGVFSSSQEAGCTTWHEVGLLSTLQSMPGRLHGQHACCGDACAGCCHWPHYLLYSSVTLPSCSVWKVWLHYAACIRL